MENAPAAIQKKLFSRPSRSATLQSMKASFRIFFRFVHGAILLTGLCALLLAAAQFTNGPWLVYKSLSEITDPFPGPPTHILVMGGSGIPGGSGLIRTFYAAQAAAELPEADVLVAMPLGPSQSVASRAYLDELRLRGVDSRRIRILDGGRNTRGQALRLAEHLAGRTNPIPCVLLVSSPEHIRRTAACIRKAFAGENREIHLGALPAFPLSIEDPLPWRAAALDRPGSVPALRSAVPDIGSSLRLRYGLWGNLGYTLDSVREGAALFYYRLRGWL